jgi:hypothetical protein
MSEPDSYPPGVPCWVDTWQPDAEAATRFYEALFGWDVEETSPPGAPRRHFMCRMRGRNVAAIGSPPPVPGHAPVWGTYVKVEDAAAAAERATEGGGKLAIEPFDALDGGRIAVLADPAGAVFAVWEQDEHRGAEIVNEPGAWAMSQLNTPEPDAAKEFYGGLFGWTTEEFDAGGGTATLWRLPGYVGGEPGQPVSREVVGVMIPIADEGPQAGQPAHWAVDFWIADADAAVATAEREGGSVVTPPYETPGFREAVLADPQGAVFSVSQLLAGP